MKIEHISERRIIELIQQKTRHTEKRCNELIRFSRKEKEAHDEDIKCLKEEIEKLDIKILVLEDILKHRDERGKIEEWEKY